jgi:hypothetical protein
MWPFACKRILDDDTAAWHLENFAWLVEQFGPTTLVRTKLVLPKPGYFAANGEVGHALALRIFDQVKSYCGMTAWDADLVAGDNPLAAERPILVTTVAPQKHAIGTFAVAGNRIQISYVPSLLARPDQLIATFAHEFAHYLLATAGETPPCADDEKEFLTDLAAVYLGFGVFLANARFSFETQRSGNMHGWRWSRSGYLPEADLIFALALFLEAKNHDPAPALTCLKPHLAKMLRRTVREQGQRQPR